MERAAGVAAEHEVTVASVGAGWSARCTCGKESPVVSAGVAHGWAAAHEETVEWDAARGASAPDRATD